MGVTRYAGDKVEFTSKVINGRMSQGDLIRMALGEFEGHVITVTIERQKKPRSINQNRYYWGVVVPIVHELFIRTGNVVSRDDVHDYLKQEIGRLGNRHIPTPYGQKEIPGSTAKLNTQEFENYLDAVRAWAAEFGVVIPLPKEGMLYDGNLNM